MIVGCLKTLYWAHEIVVIDSGSVDKTALLAKKRGAKVFINTFKDFSQQRNYSLDKVRGDWLLYIDADERVSKKLSREILNIVENNDVYQAYQIPRLNIFFGKPVFYGGWFPDYQTKLFKKEALKKWYGAVHESPQIEGKIGKLKNKLVHLTHRSLSECFEKSAFWTQLECELLFKANHPKVTIFHLFKVIIKEFGWRFFIKSGFRDGKIGWLESLNQAANKFLVYIQLWEKQQNS